MKAYDTVVIINLSQGDEKVAETLASIEKAIAGFSGQVKNIEKWGKRLLAYPIKKCSEGFYALIKFDLEPENIAKLKGKLRLNEMIIREMTLLEQPYFAPPVFSQSAEEETVGGFDEEDEDVSPVSEEIADDDDADDDSVSEEAEEETEEETEE